MDVFGIRVVLKNIRAMTERGATVFLTSHILDIVERICGRIAIIHAGRVVHDSPASEIQSRVFEEMDEGRASALERVLVELVERTPAEEVLPWLKR